MTQKDNASRREFLKRSTVVSAGAALAAGLAVERSAHAAGDDLLKVALIGCGGRGAGAAEQCLTAAPNVKLVAVADVFEDRAKAALNHLKRSQADKVDVTPERIFLGFDAYQKAIDSGVDIVLLCTPPGFRPMQYDAAIKAGKHVFMEKPCCVDAPGFRMLMEANKLADEKNLRVTVGVQRRHSVAEYRPKIKRLHDGEIGEIRLLRAYWNGGFMSGGFGSRPNGPKNEMEFQIRNWNFFRWLSGDHIVEQHVHNLDVCNWVKNGHPVEAQGVGMRQTRKAAQQYDHHFIEFTYKDGAKLFSQSRQMGNCWDCVSESVVGTKGKMDLGGNGSDGYGLEHTHLIEAIRKGEKLNDGWHGATSSFTAVLGRMASYSGQTVRWDDAVAKGPSEMPAKLAFDADPPALPDKDGNYAVPVPGMYRPY